METFFFSSYDLTNIVCFDLYGYEILVCWMLVNSISLQRDWRWTQSFWRIWVHGFFICGLMQENSMLFVSYSYTVPGWNQNFSCSCGWKSETNAIGPIFSPRTDASDVTGEGLVGCTRWYHQKVIPTWLRRTYCTSQVPLSLSRRNGPSSPQRAPVHIRGGTKATLDDTKPSNTTNWFYKRAFGGKWSPP